MRYRSENNVENRIEVLANIFGQKAQNKITLFLQTCILASVASIGFCVGHMLGAVQFDSQSKLGIEQINFHVAAAERYR